MIQTSQSQDIKSIKEHFTNRSSNGNVKQDENRPIEFQGEITFGFSGEWLVEVEAQRTENANESKILNLLVKPKLTDIQTQVIEYDYQKNQNHSSHCMMDETHFG